MSTARESEYVGCVTQSAYATMLRVFFSCILGASSACVCASSASVFHFCVCFSCMCVCAGELLVQAEPNLALVGMVVRALQTTEPSRVAAVPAANVAMACARCFQCIPEGETHHTDAADRRRHQYIGQSS